MQFIYQAVFYSGGERDLKWPFKGAMPAEYG